MIVERYIPDFWTWLLGPGWHEGLLFPWLLYLIGLLLGGGLIWAVIVGAGLVHWGGWLTPSQSHRLGRIVGYTTLLTALGVIGVMGHAHVILHAQIVYLSFPDQLHDLFGFHLWCPFLQGRLCPQAEDDSGFSALAALGFLQQISRNHQPLDL